MAFKVEDLLDKRWVHSHEEDTANSKVFRPETYKKFPRSRGRFSFELKADEKAVIYGYGVTDRSQPREGTWRVENNSLVLSSDSGQEVVFKVLSATVDRLEIEK